MNSRIDTHRQLCKYMKTAFLRRGGFFFRYKDRVVSGDIEDIPYFAWRAIHKAYDKHDGSKSSLIYFLHNAALRLMWSEYKAQQYRKPECWAHGSAEVYKDDIEPRVRRRLRGRAAVMYDLAQAHGVKAASKRLEMAPEAFANDLRRYLLAGFEDEIF